MLINPYAGKLDIKPVKSNFHIHAGTGPGTCGAYDIEPVIEAYRDCGYGALCISNHNLLTDPAPYREKYGIVLLQGYEYTTREHLLCLGSPAFTPIPEDVVFRPGSDGLEEGPFGLVHRRRNVENLQKAIDDCQSAGGYSIICHPDCHVWGVDRTVIDSVKGYDAIEILNGRNASDTYDHILSRGLLKWCTGSDDFHRWWHLAHCWNMIFAEPTEAGVLDAMRKGAMYVSKGLSLQRLELSDGRIHVKVMGGDGFEGDMEYKFIGKDGRVLKVTNDTEASYRIKGNEAYVRLDVTSPEGWKLITQPVYDDAFFTEK